VSPSALWIDPPREVSLIRIFHRKLAAAINSWKILTAGSLSVLHEVSPEKKPQPAILSMADAAVIGFAGVVLTVANPVFWASAIVALLKLELDVPFLLIIGFSTLAYALIVPGTVMWLLTVRRTNSHDMYDLMKPPLKLLVCRTWQ